MTFEEYKADFERFCEIKTPELLAICKKNYESYMVHLASQEYFEPVNLEEENDDYRKKLYKILGLHNIEENELYCLINASFKPERLLTISQQAENFILKDIALVKSYWEQYYVNEPSPVLDIIVRELTLPERLGKQLYNILLTTIMKSKKSESRWFSIDGVHYILQTLKDGKRICAQKISPNEDSRSGKITSLLNSLADSIVSGILDIEKLDSNLQMLS
ncbi:MAG: hypothetical protein J0I41_07920 [Filimonas sp.]|nr:hypothetical protein [Filimonas sp.]